LLEDLGGNNQNGWVIRELRRSFAKSSSSTPESIHIREDEVSHASFVDLARPPGRKAEKERLKKQKGNDSMISNLEGILSDIKEQRQKRYEEKMEILERAYFQIEELIQIEKQMTPR
jgi:hypothetical protein